MPTQNHSQQLELKSINRWAASSEWLLHNRPTGRHLQIDVTLRAKSDTVAVLAVLPWYPRYYRRNGYNFYGITAVLGPKYAGFPWGWGPVLRYYHGYGVEFFSCTRKLAECACKAVRTLSASQCQLWSSPCSPSCLCFNTFRLQLVFISRTY